MAKYQIKLARSDSGAQRDFTLELDSRMTVLDALFIIQREHDPSLSFRCSCRVGSAEYGCAPSCSLGCGEP